MTPRTPETCWFCRTNAPDGATYDTPLYSAVKLKLDPQGQEAVVKDGIVYLTIRIPRCAACEKKHNTQNRGALIGGVVGVLVGGLLGYVIFRFGGPLMGETVAEVIAVLVSFCTTLAGVTVGWQARNGSRETPAVIAERYPIVQSLLQAGWFWGTPDD